MYLFKNNNIKKEIVEEMASKQNNNGIINDDIVGESSTTTASASDSSESSSTREYKRAKAEQEEKRMKKMAEQELMMKKKIGNFMVKKATKAEELMKANGMKEPAPRHSRKLFDYDPKQRIYKPLGPIREEEQQEQSEVEEPYLESEFDEPSDYFSKRPSTRMRTPPKHKITPSPAKATLSPDKTTPERTGKAKPKASPKLKPQPKQMARPKAVQEDNDAEEDNSCIWEIFSSCTFHHIDKVEIHIHRNIFH